MTDGQPTRTESSGWGWLFGTAIPEEDERLYDGRFRAGETGLSVLLDAPTAATIENVEELLERYEPVDLHAEAGGLAGTAKGSPNQGEQVIPLPEEELKVGKRATERVSHVRTYVVEEPAEQEVSLRDERTVIEKRPATRTTAGQPAERDYEVREIHEEPVVEKSTQANEELVVRKEAQTRKERVQDTVKKTKADIDKEGQK